MREFLKGWRRKVGCIALVMACLTMGSWIRSLFRTDEMTIWVGASTAYFVSSTPHRIHCQRMVQAGSSLAIMDGDLNEAISFWQFVIPLTLLSAYLILWKPCSKPKPGSVTNA